MKKKSEWPHTPFAVTTVQMTLWGPRLASNRGRVAPVFTVRDQYSRDLPFSFSEGGMVDTRVSRPGKHRVGPSPQPSRHTTLTATCTITKKAGSHQAAPALCHGGRATDVPMPQAPAQPPASSERPHGFCVQALPLGQPHPTEHPETDTSALSKQKPTATWGC